MEGEPLVGVRTIAPLARSIRSRFVGREGEVGKLLALQQSGCSLVSLVGTAGVGKTRLALRFAHHHQQQGGNVWFCDVTHATSEASVLACLVKGLTDHRDTAITIDSIETLGELLQSRSSGVVVVDNFEHVVQYAPSTIGYLVDQSPKLMWIVTSRERLSIAGERCIELLPLSVSDSVQLFEQRVLDQGRTTAFGESERRVTEKLVGKLDCVPLAIELAACHGASLPIATLYEKLSRGFGLLTNKQRDAPQRHSTLYTAIAWSWDLLTDPEQRLLRSLNVFAGGFTVEALTSILGTRMHEQQILSGLDSLRDKSLIKTEVTTSEVLRYRLYESVREFLHGRFDDQGLALAHAEYYAHWGVALAQKIHSQHCVQSLNTLETEVENLASALDTVPQEHVTLRSQLAFSLSQLYTIRGPFKRQIEVLNKVLDSPSEGDLSTIVPLVLARAHAYCDQGMLDHTEKDAVYALSLLSQCEDLALKAKALCLLARCKRWQGSYEASSKLYQEALRLAQEVSGTETYTDILAEVGGAASYTNDQERSMSLVSQAMQQYQTRGDAANAAVMLTTIAINDIERGAFSAAKSKLAQSLQIHRQVGDLAWEGIAVGRQASILHEEGHIDEAIEYYQQAYRLSEVSQRPRMMAVHATLEALAWIEKDDLSNTRRCLEQSLLVTNNTSLGSFEAAIWDTIAMMEALAKNPQAALHSIQMSTKLRVDEPDIRIHAVSELAEQLVYLENASEQIDECTRQIVSAKKLVDRILGPVPSGGVQSHAVRIIGRLLRSRIVACENVSALPSQLATGTTEKSYETMVVSSDLKTVSLPDGTIVDLSRRDVLRRVLKVLVEQRHSPVTIEELVKQAWPGEKMLAKSGNDRVYAAIKGLRQLGLAPWIIHLNGGYQLHHSVVVPSVDSPTYEQLRTSTKSSR